MHHQIVRRAGAERETLWVALAAGAILVSAALAVGLRAVPDAEAPLAAHLIDSRTGLTAAEQGLYADLKAAGEEIAALRTAEGRAPTLAELAAEALPPFAADPSAAARGGHAWTFAKTGDGVAYAGVSAAPELAGSLVLRLDGHGADIWLKRAAEAPPAPPEDAALTAAGWKRIVSTFTAGVTR
ncbi:hypothetical protein Sp245p_23170 (plasmid) [Azospirillum baldaniorum]|uniref:Uncharacterized protein n=1 Tax=Azospirillum baldaniorum TaxID=1064539 RepID=A0A9P1NRK6_9PROT|nr:DUF6162 family protein [Azospirillum baldaniorum]TWA78165.1 hypothetical protein FBZ85_106325 [Azospirillum brasilense]AWJ92752.1 hypothetical protein Sp245p_23170 [Azospirillum baldaniorum]NUB05013.1 hypothetical protein [Azospirillum baldaniorum]TWA63614.1 hypothetical protein FBZ84_110137 [Azospirillum baldaniorum]CCD02717.1 conserved exported protein of unknown function [Azospirillum baldaniorum]